MTTPGIQFPIGLDVPFPRFPELSPQAIPDILNLYVVPALSALQVKVGINSSTDTNSLDYKIAHGGGGSVPTIPEGQIVFGDPTGLLTSDPAITWTGTELQLDNNYLLAFMDLSSHPLTFGVDSSGNCNLISTDSTGSPLLVFSFATENDAPQVLFNVLVGAPSLTTQALLINGSSGVINIADQDGRDAPWAIFANSGLLTWASGFVTPANEMTLAFNGDLRINGNFLPMTDDSQDLGIAIGSGGPRWHNGQFSGIVRADTGLSSATVEANQYVTGEQDITGTTAISIDLTAGAIINVALSGNTTVDATSLFSGQVCTMIFVQPPSGGPYTVAFTGVVWPSGLAPTMSVAANATDIVYLTCINSIVFGRFDKGMA